MQACPSNEKYLRPTCYCNSLAPEVIALAHALGACQRPNREYAQAAFEFAEEKTAVEICPVDCVVESLRRGDSSPVQDPFVDDDPGLVSGDGGRRPAGEKVA